MGKAENLQPLEGTAYDAQSTTPGAGSSNGCCLSCSRVRKLVSLRCVLALVLGFGVLLSAVFWLPFFHFGDQQVLDLDFQGWWDFLYVLITVFFLSLDFFGGMIIISIYCNVHIFSILGI